MNTTFKPWVETALHFAAPGILYVTAFVMSLHGPLAAFLACIPAAIGATLAMTEN